MRKKPSREMLRRIALVTGKRARIVVEHILKHGSITTEDLEKYGYKHPPRAVRDVREQGIPLQMSWVHSRGGRRIGEYRLGDPSQIQRDRLGGRKVIPKGFAETVVDLNHSRCQICLTEYELRYFQIDHRVPFEVGGEDQGRERDPAGYMPLCGSCNRAKSWSCEHCQNWRRVKNPQVCRRCYWADPVSYEHIAMRQIRRLDLVWDEGEVGDFDRLVGSAAEASATMPEFVKDVLRKHLRASR